MPFLRFSRDRRGYEHVYLMHASTRRGRPSRPRILYWYRTPPGVKVGRPPFDDEVRRTLETANPGVVFDWPTIVSTPMPAPDPAEAWRERRRLEKLAKQARRQGEAEEGENQPESSTGPVEASAPVSDPAEVVHMGEGATGGDAGEPGVRPAGARRRRRGGRRRRGQAGGGTEGQAPAPSFGMSQKPPLAAAVDPAVPAGSNSPDLHADEEATDSDDGI